MLFWFHAENTYRQKCLVVEIEFKPHFFSCSNERAGLVKCFIRDKFRLKYISLKVVLTFTKYVESFHVHIIVSIL